MKTKYFLVITHHSLNIFFKKGKREMKIHPHLLNLSKTFQKFVGAPLKAVYISTNPSYVQVEI